MTIFDDMADSIFTDDNFSSVATYMMGSGTTSSVRVVVDKDVDTLVMGESELTDRRTVIGIRKSDIPTPYPGETITVGSTIYTIDNVIADDGIEVQVSVK